MAQKCPNNISLSSRHPFKVPKSFIPPCIFFVLAQKFSHSVIFLLLCHHVVPIASDIYGSKPIFFRHRCPRNLSHVVWTPFSTDGPVNRCPVVFSILVANGVSRLRKLLQTATWSTRIRSARAALKGTSSVEVFITRRTNLS